jgi:hypothetical protein
MSTTALVLIFGLLIAALVTAWATVHFGSWRHLLIGAVGVMVSIVFGAWLYTKRPEPLPTACSLPTTVNELGTICGFKNPEDLQHIASLGLILTSEEGFGGRLLSLQRDNLSAGARILWPPNVEGLVEMAAQGGDLGDHNCPFPSDPAKLWPHGLSALEPSDASKPVRVAFVSHRLVNDILTDSIQLFDLSADTTQPLRWRGCLNMPDDVMGNDIAYLRDGSLVATNFAPRGTLAQLNRYARRGGLGIDTGDILRWSREQGWSHIPNTRGALPNGIAISADEKTLYYSDAGNSQVVILPLTEASSEAFRVSVGGAPNNLTVTHAGKILATGATLSGDLPVICSLGGRQCRSGWAVWEIDPATGSVVEIAAEQGKLIASATTALEVGDTVFIGSMADDRVGVYRRR